MYKKVILVFIVVAMIGVVACAANTQHKSTPVSSEKKNVPEQKIEITTKEEKYTSEQIEVDVKIPILSGLKDKNIENKINQLIENEIFEFKTSGEEVAKEFYEKANTEDFPPFQRHSVYVAFEVKTLREDLLSLQVSYSSYTGGAHGSTNVITYNYNLNTGKEINFKDLFKENSNFKKIINEEIKRQMNKDPESYFQEQIENFRGITDEELFFIKDGNLIIYFGLYDIAPYAGGIPEFVIPSDLIKDILNPSINL